MQAQGGSKMSSSARALPVATLFVKENGSDAVDVTLLGLLWLEFATGR